MGLAIEIGMLADLNIHDEEGAEWLRQSITNANEVLVEHGLPIHDEPESLPELADRSVLEGFPYSFVHYLRRAYAHWKQKPGLRATPFPPDENPADDPAVDEESCMMDSHLLCHSDCEGFYFPVSFENVVIDDKDKGRIEGGLLGSSFQLLEELKAMAPALGIRLENGHLPDSEVDAIRADVESEADLWIERGVWLTFYEAARLSIQHKTAICFN